MTDRSVFLSCARVDNERADRLQRILESAGIRVDREDAAGARVFLACFSADGLFRDRPYSYEQFSRASGPPVPVRFDDCEIPPWSCADGALLDSVPATDVFDQRFEDGAASVAARVRELLGPEAAPARARPAATVTSSPGTRVPASTDESLAHRIRNARFSTTRLRPGYDEREVDRFLDEVTAAALDLGRQVDLLKALLEAAPSREDAAAAAAEMEPLPSLTPELVRDKRFSPTRLRPGYAIQDVDTFLARTAADLEFLTATRQVLLSRLSP